MRNEKTKGTTLRSSCLSSTCTQGRIAIAKSIAPQRNDHQRKCWSRGDCDTEASLDAALSQSPQLQFDDEFSSPRGERLQQDGEVFAITANLPVS